MVEFPNHFDHRTAAQRYAAGRPYFHPFVVERIRLQTGVERFRSALDVACGTGQSTRAIAAIADDVVGIDSSAEMLAFATPSPRTSYLVASAESLPFGDGRFDLITVSMALHWFDQGRFLGEARRALRDEGWLIVYNAGDLGQIAEDPAFHDWCGDAYGTHFPKPARSAETLSDPLLAAHHFKLIESETHHFELAMSHEECVRYFLSHSNVIAKVEEGSETIESAAAFIREGIRPFFRTERVTLRFRVNIQYLR
jgi:ubiquinone/menaquinone biosynthesis C-methylase UbiE